MVNSSDEQSNVVLNTDLMGLGLISLELIGLRNLSPRTSPFKIGNHCFIQSESMQGFLDENHVSYGNFWSYNASSKHFHTLS